MCSGAYGRRSVVKFETAFLATTVMAASCVLAASMPTAPDPRVGDGGVSAFYQWSTALPDQPGRLLRQEALEPEFTVPGASAGARVLYSSTDGMDDHSRTV